MPNNNNNHRESDGQTFGCYICEDNVKALEESSLEFLVTQKLSSDPNNEHNLDLQTLKTVSNPQNKAQENGSHGREQNENQVPFSDNRSHAIRITANTGAKENAIQLMQTNDNKQTFGEDMKSNNNTLNYNNIHKQRVEKSSHEDYDKDISNTFDDW